MYGSMTEKIRYVERNNESKKIKNLENYRKRNEKKMLKTSRVCERTTVESSDNVDKRIRIIEVKINCRIKR